MLQGRKKDMAEQSPDILHPSTYLKWDEWPSLRVEMSSAHVVCCNETVFVSGGSTKELGWRRSKASLYSFRPGVDSTWTQMDTPTYFYTLTEHNSQLLLVGGREYPEELTNKVYTLTDARFVETLPPMREKRSWASAVSSGSALVVAGGYNTSLRDLSSVEVYKDGQWTTASSLPTAGYDMKSALHGDQWYLIRWDGKVFHTSLHSLLSKEAQSPWKTLPDTHHDSAAAVFGGHLLSIGGNLRNKAIYAYSESSQSWEHVGDLPHPLKESSATVLPTEQLIVVGEYGDMTTSVFRAFIKAPLVGPNISFTVPKLFRLNRYGVNLIKALSRDRYRFHVTTGVQLLKKDRLKVPTLSAKDYIELIFKAWERSNQPTYPATWEGLFTVLRKLDLGHLVEQIAKCVTGSEPMIESSPQTSDSEGSVGKEKMSLTDAMVAKKLRHEIEDLITTQAEEVDLLSEQIDNLTKENEQLRALLRANSQSESWPPHIKQEPATVKDEPESDLACPPRPAVTGEKRRQDTEEEQGLHVASSKRPRSEVSSEN